MSHKDLRDDWRERVNRAACCLAEELHDAGQSLAIAREAFINEFDRLAAKLDAE